MYLENLKNVVHYHNVEYYIRCSITLLILTAKNT